MSGRRQKVDEWDEGLVERRTMRESDGSLVRWVMKMVRRWELVG